MCCGIKTPVCVTEGREVAQVSVRGKQNDATVTKMPFVPNTYYKG